MQRPPASPVTHNGQVKYYFRRFISTTLATFINRYSDTALNSTPLGWIQWRTRTHSSSLTHCRSSTRLHCIALFKWSISCTFRTSTILGTFIHRARIRRAQQRRLNCGWLAIWWLNCFANHSLTSSLLAQSFIGPYLWNYIVDAPYQYCAILADWTNVPLCSYKIIVFVGN